MTYRRAIMRGQYRDAIASGGQRMTRTYNDGRVVEYLWSETDPATGAGVWLIA